MEVQYIILLCLIVVRQTSGKKKNVTIMAGDVEDKCKDYSSKSNCKDVSNFFEEETAAGGECYNKDSTYLKTISKIPPVSSTNSMLLWSGCGMKGEAKRIKTSTQPTYTTVDQTIIGKTFFGLHWKKKSEKDIYYMNDKKDTPIYWTGGNCDSPFEYIFWALLSNQFASRGRGVVNVILSAKSDNGAYDPESIFGKYEAPNLSSATRLQVYLYDADDKKDKCDHNDYIKDLKELVEDVLKIEFRCTSDDLPPGNYEKSSYDVRYDASECAGGCVMKLSTHILVVVSFVHLFIK